MLLAGDCLDHLPVLARDPAQRFQLIYVDPPFNAGGKRSARRETGPRSEGDFAYEDEWGGLDAFLAMLEPRLAALGPLLAPQGSLWVHLDQRAIHEVKVMLDRQLGREAFRGEVIWVPGNGGRRRKVGPPMTHQTILVYAPGQMRYDGSAPELRESFAPGSLRTHFRHVDETGRAYRERVVNGKAYRYYADEGRALGSVWTDCPSMAANTPLSAETSGYPTQKPLKLLERIVVAATEPGAAVLDPMCGSGTTLVAAEKRGRRWVGIDRSPVALEISRKRLEDTGVSFPQ